MLQYKGYREGSEVDKGKPLERGFLKQSWREAGKDVNLRFQELLGGLACSL